MKMKRLRIVPIIFAVGLSIGLASCSSKKSDTSAGVEEEMMNSHLFEALENKDYTRVTSIADSLAFDVDDLSNNESVAVLLAYLNVHNHYSKKGNSKKDLETLRKFVDVYDLSLQRDRSGMIAAIEQAKEANPEVDLAALYTSFRAKLSEYDAVQGADLTVESHSAKSDSTIVISDSTKVKGNESDLPVEMRPAD